MDGGNIHEGRDPGRRKSNGGQVEEYGFFYKKGNYISFIQQIFVEQELFARCFKYMLGYSVKTEEAAVCENKMS